MKSTKQGSGSSTRSLKEIEEIAGAHCIFAVLLHE
jgi:hypothetical protein